MYRLNHVVFVLLFRLFGNTEGFTDPLLKHYNKHFAQLKSMPKLWAVYVERTMKEALMNVKFTSYQGSNLDIISFVRIFLHFQRNEINRCNKDYLHCLPMLPDFPPSVSEDVDVLRPVGSLCFDSLEKDFKSIVMRFHDRLLNILNTWVLNLDPNLSLNVTVLHIDIIKVFGSCLRGKFLIRNFLWKKFYFSEFSYCGRYSTLRHYSSSKGISLSVQFLWDVTVELNLLYSVMSANMISSRSVGKYPTLFKLIQHLSVFVTTIFSYHIQASKIHHICIRIKLRENLSFSVVDSPHFEDVWIDLMTNKFCGSTFQILLHAFLSSSHYINIPTLVEYYEKVPVGEQHLTANINKIETLKVPNENCQKVRFCVWKFKAPVQKKIHYVIDMIFHGMTTTNCMYGGIALFDGKKHIVDICKDYGGKVPSRNVYSGNSTSFLTAYTYQPFSFLEVRVRIKTTICKPVILHVCQIAFFCNSHLSPGYNLYQCIERLEKVSKNSSLVFKIDRLGSVKYSLKYGDCVIIQVTNDVSRSVEPIITQSNIGSCIATFSPEILMEKNRVIKYQVTGFSLLLKSIPAKLQHQFGTPINYGPYSTRETNIWTSFKNWTDVPRFGVKCKGNVNKVKIFASNLTTFTPHLTRNKIYLIFMLWKSSVFQIDIKMSYSVAPSTQQNLHLEDWRFPEGDVKLLSEFNSEIFVVRIQNIMKCFPENRNNWMFGLWLFIKATTSINVVYLQYQTINLLLHIQLSCLVPAFYLSLPGAINVIDYKTLDINSTVKVESFWMNGILPEHNHFKCYGEYCRSQMSKYLPKFTDFSNSNVSHQALTYKFRNHLMYMVFRSYRIINNEDIILDYPPFRLQKYLKKINYFNEKSFHLSWKTASHLCKGLGGHLPVFYDRADIEEFASFFKVARVPLLNAIFIGLHFDTKKKVCD